MQKLLNCFTVVTVKSENTIRFHKVPRTCGQDTKFRLLKFGLGLPAVSVPSSRNLFQIQFEQEFQHRHQNLVKLDLPKWMIICIKGWLNSESGFCKKAAETWFITLLYFLILHFNCAMVKDTSTSCLILKIKSEDQNNPISIKSQFHRNINACQFLWKYGRH